MNELITINNGQATASSKDVANNFEKSHNHVLRDIDELKKDVSNFGQMFFEAEISDSYGRSQRAYYMNRDGFTLLCMGFTGSKAMEWKIKYIEAFNKMEEVIKEQSTAVLSDLSPQLQFMINIEREQNRQKARLDAVEKNIELFIAPPPVDWQKEMNGKITALCKNNSLDYEQTRSDLYKEVERICHCNLEARVSNAKKRVASEEGYTKAQCNRINKLSVIAAEPALKAVYEVQFQKLCARCNSATGKAVQ